jgi:hypothetical protein
VPFFLVRPAGRTLQRVKVPSRPDKGNCIAAYPMCAWQGAAFREYWKTNNRSPSISSPAFCCNGWGNRLLLSGLNSNLSLGDRIEPKSCCFGFPHEEGVPLFPKSWCCASSKAASCDSATCPPLQAEIRTRSRSAAPPRAFWPPCLGAANSSSPLESSAATSGKGCCGPAEIRLRPPFENYPTRCIFPLRGPGVHADSDPKSGVPDQAC